MELRAFLRGLFEQTLRHADLREQMRLRVLVESGRLQIDDASFALDAFERVLVVAVGKAAVPMYAQMMDTLVPVGITVEGLVVGGEAVERREGVRYWRGGHPLPDATSREAAAAILHTLAGVGAKTLVLFLISGGASAMLELPLDTTITVEETAAFYGALVHSGLPITSMNALRKHFSAVKGGRLAMGARAATQYTLLVSDVPEGQLDCVGSGPSLADSTTVEECRAILRSSGLLAKLTERVREFFEAKDLPETPKPAEFVVQPGVCVLLSSATLTEGAAAYAERAGYRVVVDNGCDDWDYREAAAHLLARFEKERSDGGRVCVLSAGEVTVTIDGPAGIGGRNQQFALEMARLVADRADVAVLSAGSDGIDGNSSAAGAVVDGTTWRRAEEAGLAPERALARFDSSPLFEQLGDAVVTGATGNNLRDLRVLISR